MKNNKKLTMKECVKNLWNNHKGKIILTGICIGVGVIFLIKNSSTNIKETKNIKQTGYDEFSIYWLQGNEESSGVPWTLDLPVGGEHTVESALRGALEDLNSGKYNRIIP